MLWLYGGQWIQLQWRPGFMSISIIIPVFNEADNIVDLLLSLSVLRIAGHEVILVDGGSTDSTPDLARPHCDQLIHSAKGRAVQMNTGARHASGDVFWFLHADSRLPRSTVDVAPSVLLDHSWGRFDVSLSGSRMSYRVIERMMNLRSRVTGIVTGDQAIFVSRDLFWSVNGYPEIPLMEDVALSSELVKKTRPTNLPHRVQTSSRRWEQKGVLPTVLLMWRLRLEYFLGTDPGFLVKKYYT